MSKKVMSSGAREFFVDFIKEVVKSKFATSSTLLMKCKFPEIKWQWLFRNLGLSLEKCGINFPLRSKNFGRRAFGKNVSSDP